MRATRPAARRARRRQILDAAGEAFDQVGIEDVSMDWLASLAGVAKGTLYLYFPTRESVFLALYQRELDAWCMALETLLDRLPADNILRVAGAMVDSLESHPRLPPLAAILHTSLERNVDADNLSVFQQWRLQRFGRIAGRLENRLSFLAEGEGLRLLRRSPGFS
jgi:AcrR family transcriptional regulator